MVASVLGVRVVVHKSGKIDRVRKLRTHRSQDAPKRQTKCLFVLQILVYIRQFMLTQNVGRMAGYFILWRVVNLRGL